MQRHEDDAPSGDIDERTKSEPAPTGGDEDAFDDDVDVEVDDDASSKDEDDEDDDEDEKDEDDDEDEKDDDDDDGLDYFLGEVDDDA